MFEDEDFKLVKFQMHFLRVSIHCDGCRDSVRKLLRRVEGVFEVSVDVEDQKVSVTGDVDSGTLIRKLARSGKHAELWSPSSKIQNKHKQEKPTADFLGQAANHNAKKSSGNGKGNNGQGVAGSGGKQSQNQVKSPNGGTTNGKPPNHHPSQKQQQQQQAAPASMLAGSGSNGMMMHDGSRFMHQQQQQLMYQKSPRISPLTSYCYYQQLDQRASWDHGAVHLFSDENTSSCAIM